MGEEVVPRRGAAYLGPTVQTASEDALRELLPPEVQKAALEAALREDLASGDLTSEHCIPERLSARGRLVAKQAGVIAGLPVFEGCLALCCQELKFEALVRDGERVSAGQLLARMAGDGQGLLVAERTALNFMQRMCGVATLTARFVELAAGRARILDTRKTTPGLRAFEKYAVRCGGGENHRFGLFDQAMLKENHFALCLASTEQGLASAEIAAEDSLQAVSARLRERLGPDTLMTVEARDESEAQAAVRGGADIVLLDNMSSERMGEIIPGLHELAEQRGRSLEIEASGGIDEARVAEVAACGVDRISIGALTHSAAALDLSLYLEPAS